MGLAKAMTTGILTTPRYSKNWEMLPLEKLKPQYERVMTFLTSEAHGEFFAVEELFGTRMATMLVKRGDIKNRASATAGPSNPNIRRNTRNEARAVVVDRTPNPYYVFR
jgi:hypothetical protein